MKTETITGAFVATLIAFVTAFLALLQTPGIDGISDIPESAWWVLLGGGAVTFLKDYQALSARRAISKLTGTGDG